MNILENPQHKAQIGYNPFDMSKTLKFSSSVGHILPVYYDLLNPGDKITARTQHKTRTMPLDSGAFTSIEENIDWFFVPMEQLYHAFSEFYYGVQDFNSSFFNTSQFNPNYPSFNIADLVQSLLALKDENPYGFNSVDLLPACSLRILDLLGFPLDAIKAAALKIAQGKQSELVNYKFIPVLLQAYQKIYADFYRLSDREANIPASYNLDNAYSAGTAAPALQYLLKPHYIAWKKDFFTNLQISPIFGPDNISGVSNYNYSAVNQWLDNTFGLNLINSEGNPVESSSNKDATTVGIYSQDIVTDTKSLSVANIRAMFALDKLLEITRRAGKHYDKQTLAHFGVDVPKGIAGECYLLNHSVSKIDIGDIIATSTGQASLPDSSQSATSVLGQVGGKGFGANDSSQFTFEAPAHGVLMAVYYARPVADYYQTGVDKINTLVESVDWFKPEFDNLGMVPAFGAQNLFNATLESSNTRVLGWQYRYSELKNKPNTIHGNMAFIDNFKIWSTGKNPLISNSLSNFLVNPNYLDNIMMVDYVSTLSPTTFDIKDIFKTDPLLHQIYFDVRKASKMSTFGLPQL